MLPDWTFLDTFEIFVRHKMQKKYILELYYTSLQFRIKFSVGYRLPDWSHLYRFEIRTQSNFSLVTILNMSLSVNRNGNSALWCCQIGHIWTLEIFGRHKMQKKKKRLQVCYLFVYLFNFGLSCIYSLRWLQERNGSCIGFWCGNLATPEGSHSAGLLEPKTWFCSHVVQPAVLADNMVTHRWRLHGVHTHYTAH